MRAGYAVDVAQTVAGALDKLAFNEYDLLLLDITLPDGDGWSICRTVRGDPLHTVDSGNLRIMMLTARSDVAERVRGLDLVADDYLVKPFAVTELLARVRALLRRDVTGGSSELRVGDVTLDDSRNVVWRAGTKVALTTMEFAVLR